MISATNYKYVSIIVIIFLFIYAIYNNEKFKSIIDLVLAVPIAYVDYLTRSHLLL